MARKVSPALVDLLGLIVPAGIADSLQGLSRLRALYNSKEKSLKYIAWILSWAGKLVVLDCTSENLKIILFRQYNFPT